MKPGPKPASVPEAQQKRWASLRSLAVERSQQRNQEDRSSFDTLEAVAWTTGSSNIADSQLDDTVRAARKAGATWSEIAVAMGEPDSKESSNRVKNRFFRRL